MSLERFFALYFPLKSKTVCTMKTAKWSTGSLALIFLAYNVQYLVIYKSKVTDRVYSCLFPNKKLLAVLDRVDSVLYSFGTFTVMILVNSAIIAMFMKAKCQNLLGNTVESTAQALTKYAARGTTMVVTASITFIILTVPVAIDQVTGRKLTPYPLYYAFMTSMQYLNHSINGVLYCIVGTKFREEMIKLLKCRIKASGANYRESTVGVSTVTSEGF